MASGVCKQRLALLEQPCTVVALTGHLRAYRPERRQASLLRTCQHLPNSSHQHDRAAVTSCRRAVGSHEAEQVEDLMPEPLKDPSQRSAALHDFCMAIPYGLILLLSGAVSLCLGAGWSGGRTLVAGCFSLALANASLQNWRSAHRTRLPAFITAGIAAAVTAAKFQRTRMVQVPWVRWSNFALSGVSAAMFLFLCYNILAGGNPIKKPESDALEEGDTEAALPQPAS